ncbi:MAG: polyamine aminopropyltransferase [Gammaproteobacteria bacterium]|nr:polyamine aminopropyltransferase [Gammaproteobacteria bacterium]
MSLDASWYTEIHTAQGSAFSLKIKEKLLDEQSPFQRIEVYETEGFGTLMTLDGLVMVTDLDNFIYHEMVSHPVLFTHPDPKDVLIIGGGDCGTLREVLKHPGVIRAQQVDIDEGVTRAAERFFPELCESNNDPRAELYFDNGIQWVKDAAPGSYDIIIVDSTDPVGPAEGLFSAPFFRDCHRALRDGGLIVQQSESPLYHKKLIDDMHATMRGTGFASTLTLGFPQCSYPSGWWSATMAGKGGDLSAFREQDAARKPFKTRYYNAAIHRAAMALPEFMKI